MVTVGAMPIPMAMEAGVDVVIMAAIGDGTTIITEISMEEASMGTVGIQDFTMVIIMAGVMATKQVLGLLTMVIIMLLLLRMQRILFITEVVEVLML